MLLEKNSLMRPYEVSRNEWKNMQLSASIVIPTLGIEPALTETIEKVLAAYSLKERKGVEILIVHTPRGDSKKYIREIVSRFAPYVREVIEPRKGYGIAYMTGFANSSADIIVTLDGDMTYPAFLIPRLCRYLERSGADFINTNRLAKFDPGAFNWAHKFGNGFLTALTNLLFFTGLSDSQSGMWIFKKSIWPQLDCVGVHWEFSAEIKLEAVRKGFRCTEVPIPYKRRMEGKTTNSVKEGIKIAIFLFAKRFGLGRYFEIMRR
jgi:hypothetical protein